MPVTAKKAALILGAVLVLALPLTLLTASFLSPSLPRDCHSAEYFAITDALGREYVFPPEDEVFSVAADAFLAGKHLSSPPPWWEEGRASLLLDWIRDGHARRYRLYLSPAPLGAYLTDSRGRGFSLDEAGTLLFLRHPSAASLLLGEAPPVLTLAGEEVPPSVCEWRYTVTPTEGEPFVISSGEYLQEGVGSYPLAPDAFAPLFEVTPAACRYRLFAGEHEIFDGEAPPALSALPTGEYQLVLVALFERGAELLRAGYSFSLSVS